MLSTRLHILSLLLLVNTFAFAQTIRYVTPVGKNTNPATAVSWAASTTDLQGAINASQAGDQVWVAGGTYKPGGNANANRSISFSMKNDVAIYGGFTGNETMLSQRPVPNPVNGQPSSSTLSGEIGDPNSTTDNSYHVISNPAGLTTTAILDGFVITGGYTEQTTSTVFGNSRGGGVYNAGNNSSPCNPKFISCLFNNNQAFFGGAMYNSLSSPILYNCTFSNNKASYGGAMVNIGTCNLQAINCGFLNNTALYFGGSLFNAAATGLCKPAFLSCSFQNNFAPTGSVMDNSVDVIGDCITSLTNCILFNNNGSNDIKNSFAKVIATYSLFEPTAVSNIAGLDLSGPGNLTNITVSPFASTTSVVLAPNSPAINAGDPATSSATVGMTDLAGNPRFVGRIDMGAVEFQGILEMYTLKNGNWNDPSVWSLSRVPQPGERVRLRHTVTIPAGFTASGLILSYDPDGRLIHEAGTKLQLGN